MSSSPVSSASSPAFSLSERSALRVATALGAANSVVELQKLVATELVDWAGARAGELVAGHELPPARADWRGFDLKENQEIVGALFLQGADEFLLVEEQHLELALICRCLASCLSKLQLIKQIETIKREWNVMLDGMTEGVYVCSELGLILRGNRAFADMIDREVTEVVGESRDVLWGALSAFEVLTNWHETTQENAGFVTWSREFRFEQPERIVVETAFELTPTTLHAGGFGDFDEKLLLCVVRDATESRRWQEQIIQSEKLAALGELTSGVAHELNNPLATVVGYAELVGREPNLPDTTRRRLDTIHQEALRASHIVQNLLAYARRSSTDKEFVNINEVVEAALSMRRYQLSTDNVRVLSDFSAQVSPIWGDAMQLQQVVLNIVNNAVQAMQSWRGSGEIRLSTRAIAFNGRPGVRLVIEDNGPGIAPDHLRRVFDPFFTTKPTGEGTGLGMSIAQRIISNHEGLLWAESRLGHGARFIIELPGAVGSDVVVDEPEDTPFYPQSTNLNGARVLVIDDEEPVITLLSEILAIEGHRVTAAFNGAEAIALLQADDYDLILSDVRMPAVGGPTFFEILQTTRPDLLEKVIFVTGDTMSQSTRDFLQRAGRPVVEKPFEPEQLRAMVAQTLGQE